MVERVRFTKLAAAEDALRHNNIPVRVHFSQRLRLAQEPTAPSISPGESRTTAQVAGGGISYTGETDTPHRNKYEKYRQMRVHPTVALARNTLVSALQFGDWEVKAKDQADEAQVKFAQDLKDRWREYVVERAVSGSADFGWCGFEVVYGIDEEDGTLTVRKFKQLLQDITTILVDKTTGEFAGFKQVVEGRTIVVPAEYAMHCGFRVEGDELYGQAILLQTEYPYDRWVKTDKVAAFYDERVAGASYVVKYPLGQTLFNGVLTDNAEIAKTILKLLQSSRSVIVPNVFLEHEQATGMPTPEWVIDVIQDTSPKQYGFTDRLKYLDICIVRSFFWPERSILEGTFGTKAEAETHLGIGMLGLLSQDAVILKAMNGVLSRLLVANWGPEAANVVTYEHMSAQDERMAFLETLYLALIALPGGLEADTVDTDALKDRLGVPKGAEVAGMNEDGPQSEDDGTEEDDDEEQQTTPPPGSLSLGRYKPRRFKARLETGKFTADGTGLASRFGSDYEGADIMLREVRGLATSGRFDEAREMLFNVSRTRSTDRKAHSAVQHRVAQMIKRLASMEEMYTSVA